MQKSKQCSCSILSNRTKLICTALFIALVKGVSLFHKVYLGTRFNKNKVLTTSKIILTLRAAKQMCHVCSCYYFNTWCISEKCNFCQSQNVPIYFSNNGLGKKSFFYSVIIIIVFCFPKFWQPCYFHFDSCTFLNIFCFSLKCNFCSSLNVASSVVFTRTAPLLLTRWATQGVTQEQKQQDCTMTFHYRILPGCILQCCVVYTRPAPSLSPDYFVTFSKPDWHLPRTLSHCSEWGTLAFSKCSPTSFFNVAHFTLHHFWPFIFFPTSYFVLTHLSLLY